MSQVHSQTPDGRYSALTRRHLDTIAGLTGLSRENLFNVRVVSSVLPFRTNRYVIRHLIDWDRVPDDPVYQLVFPSQACWQKMTSRPWPIWS